MHFWPMYISPSGNFLSLFPLHFIFHQCPPVMSYLGLFVYYIMQIQGLETSIILTKEILTNLRINDPRSHTSYLSFLLHRQDFRKPNFTPKKTTKGTKNNKNVSEKVKYMHFFTQSGKIYT